MDGLVQQMQFFSRLEANCFAGSDGDFGSGSGVASDSGLARFDGKYAKAAEFDAVASDQRLLHALENSVHRSLCFCAWQAGALNYPLYKILLYHCGPPPFGL